MPQRITKQTIRLLESFLDEPAREWYGLELIERSDLSSGTVYPLLHRLALEGWLDSAHEEIDPHEAGRPRRRLYSLSGLGETEGRRVLADRRHVRAGATGLRPHGVHA